jgi:SAM-dependent methyltransferase
MGFIRDTKARIQHDEAENAVHEPTSTSDSCAPSGRDRFDAIYHDDLDAAARWLEIGAVPKVASLQAVLAQAGIRPQSLLELGCGTGAVIRECQRRGVADELTGMDYSEVAIAYLSAHTHGIRCVQADIMTPGIDFGGPYDIVVLSHVLEHLEEPLALLRSLTAHVRFRYLVAEVPLEDLWAGRLKGLFRDRTNNAAGHVQFYTRRSFRELLAQAGLTIDVDRRYVPILSPDAIALVAPRNRFPRLRTVSMLATNRWLPRVLGPLWERLYYAHYTVLAQRSDG